jgi:hypothetical protein
VLRRVQALVPLDIHRRQSWHGQAAGEVRVAWRRTGCRPP